MNFVTKQDRSRKSNYPDPTRGLCASCTIFWGLYPRAARYGHADGTKRQRLRG